MLITFFMDRNYVCYFPFLGEWLSFNTVSENRCNGFDIEEAKSFVMRIEISSWPWALFWSKDLIILIISSTQNSKNESVSLVSKFIFTGSLLPLDIGVHYLAKKSLNRFALSKKSVTSFLSASSGGMCGILLSLTMFSRWPSMFLGLFLGNLVY